MGYLIKLDTNGSRPQVIEKVMSLKLVNYIAMDVKASLGRYNEVVGVKFLVDQIKQSIDIIMASGIKHEFRTTVVKSLCSYDDICEMVQMVEGAQHYTIQRPRIDEKILDTSLIGQEQYSESEFKNLEQLWN